MTCPMRRFLHAPTPSTGIFVHFNAIAVFHSLIRIKGTHSRLGQRLVMVRESRALPRPSIPEHGMMNYI